jgi:hypothetical protein
MGTEVEMCLTRQAMAIYSVDSFQMLGQSMKLLISLTEHL